jgi:hypothetical protein
MKKPNICYGAVAILLVCLFVLSEARAISPPEKGKALPEIVLTVPADAAERHYLGLSESGNFKIPDIKAKVVIIEVFNMY